MEKQAIDVLLKEIAALQYSNPEEAFAQNEEALAASQLAQYEIGYGLALNNKGNYYFWRDESDTALDWYIKADRTLSKSADWEDRIIAKSNIAMVFSKINEPAKCLEVYREIENELVNHPVNIKHAQVYLNIDVVLLAQGKAEEAKNYATKAYAIAQQLNHPFGISISANHIAGCCLEMGDADNAEKYITECFELDTTHGFTQQLCMDHFRATVISNKKKQYSKSIQYAIDGLAILEQNPNAETKNGILAALAEAYEANGEYKEALQTQKLLLEEKLAYVSAEKAKAIVGINGKYNLEKKEAQLREIQLQKLDAELKAIKSQMNPHFAFNTLKTIDYMLETNKVSEARKSLQSFAQLMRATLEQSGNDFTVIADEVLLLENYIRLEKNALGESFIYTIDVDPAIDQSYERVPSILLQPIVENAIKHGLRHKEGAKALHIHFESSIDGLAVSIEDNGIGRKASEALNILRTGHQSFAGSAMLKRIDFLNEKAGYNKYSLTTQDLTNGTRVNLRCLAEKTIL
ncbi:MAG TPA: histidine kinase [Chitinophagales bacterium]|nr:histidine kinase [Chitinophagales bacterium]